jgi:hypothetical protein
MQKCMHAACLEARAPYAAAIPSEQHASALDHLKKAVLCAALETLELIQEALLRR